MSAFTPVPFARLKLGYYGNLTTAIPALDMLKPHHPFDSSTYDWLSCLTSLPAILLGFWGCYASLRDGLPRRYAVGYLGLVLIAIGSIAAHGLTVLWGSLQLAELSKTCFAFHVVYLLLDSRPGFDIDPLYALVSAAGSILLSAAYLLLSSPIYHHVTLAIIISVCLGRYLILVRTHPLAMSTSDKTAKLGTLFWATNTLILGSMALKVDDLLYERLRGVREAMGPLGFLLGGQAYWNLLSTYGVYLFYTSCVYLVLTVKTAPGTFDYDASAWVPTCYRVGGVDCGRTGSL